VLTNRGECYSRVGDVTQDDLDVDQVLDRIESGESQAEIAESLGVSPPTLCRWLKSDESTAKRSAQAREESAEAWLDKGLGVLSKALYKDAGMDAGAARAYAQECARRAAIRNPKYSEKMAIGGAEGLPPIKTEMSLTEATRQIAFALAQSARKTEAKE